MEDARFIEMIMEHFRRPLDDHGFSLANRPDGSIYKDQFAAFASGRCGVGFSLDKGDVFMSVVSASSECAWGQGLPGRWVDVSLVIAFLTPQMTAQGLARFYYPAIASRLPRASRIEQQLAQLASKVDSHWDQVIELCKTGELNKHRDELEQLEKRRGEVVMKEIMEKAAKRDADDTKR